MPEDADSINQEQYDQYTANWAALIDSGNDGALAQAFQAPGAARINFLNFSIDQILALVTAADAHSIKARLLLIPDATGQACFAITLFATDAAGQRLSEYYIPSQAAAATTQAVEPAAGASTEIPRATAVHWLTDWVTASSLTTSMFTTTSGPLQGSNFEVSTFQDPLAAAQPYAGKGLYLNLGLYTPGTGATPTLALVVYIAGLGRRAQGSVEGLPTGDVFYDMGMPAPPAP